VIVGLVGSVEHKEPACVHMNVGGVIYEVFISLQTFGAINQKELKLFTCHIIREDAQLLYGFMEMSEKRMFERLIKISGVGPKVAMAICSTYTPSQFASVITSSDVKAVQKVPGVGPKSAGRILVELNGFDTELVTTALPQNQAYSQAQEALESLGFKKDKIAKALSACNASDTSSLVKEALRMLQSV
jgi:Holliday junction DNA helicase RuvA